MYRIKRFLPCLLAALMLTACGSGTEGTDPNAQRPGNDFHNDPVQLTEIRTPTPTLPAGQTNPPTPDRPTNPGGNQGGNQGDNQGGGQDEMGVGAELEGYYQLLSYIDQSSISGPDGWARHEVDDMLDGLFESTDNGSNKYGQNLTAVDVTWKMTRSVKLSAYAIYTANDTESFPERNPKSWTLYGSSDGKDWEVIHSVEDGQLPTANYTPTLFTFENDQAYRYYRWSMESTVGGGTFQLSELLMYTREEPEQEEFGGEGQPDQGDQPDGLPAYGGAATGVSASPLMDAEAEKWIEEHTVLTDLVDIHSVSSSVSSFVNTEEANRLFDGVYTEADFHQNGTGKWCGPADRGYVYWMMNEAVTPTGYALVTGNDTAEYPDRNPVSWVLYGAKEDGEWAVLDAVKEGNLQPADFAVHVFPLTNTKSYTRFCLMVEQANGVVQLCELILCQ